MFSLRYSLTTGALFFFCLRMSAQQNDLAALKSLEDSCVYYFNNTGNATPDNEKEALNLKFSVTLKKALQLYSSFSYPFDSLKKVGRIYAPDNSFRMITWNIFLNSGVYKYFGFLQVFNSKTQTNKVFELIDRSEEIQNPENSVLSAGKWYGSLYYKIIPEETDNRKYYTLLGLQYHDLVLTRKVIDILFFDSWGNPVFGAPIIQVNNKIKHRIVLQYSAQSSVNLKYDEKTRMIMFDHLAPEDEKYTNMFEYYGPDLTFDGLKFKKGNWIYQSNLDLRRPTKTSVKAKLPR